METSIDIAMSKNANESFLSELRNIASDLDIKGPGLSGMEYGLIFLVSLVKEGALDEAVLGDCLGVWEKFPKNASALRQALFERDGETGEKISKADAMLKKYLKGGEPEGEAEGEEA